MKIDSFYSIIGLTLFLLIIVITTWRANKKIKINKSFENYIMGGRSFSWFFIALTLLGTYIGGGTLMGLSGKIGEAGVVYLFMPIGVAIAFLLFAWSVKKYRSRGIIKVKYVEEDKPTSLVDRFAREYSEKVSVHFASFVLIIMVSFIAVQIRAGGIIIGYIFNINEILANFLVLLLVGAYIYKGGTHADILTDVIQVLIIFVVLILTFVFLLWNIGASNITHNLQVNTPNLIRLPENAWILILGFIILPIFSIHTDAGIHQRVLIAKDDKNARKALIIASILYVIFGAILVLLSIDAKSNNLGGSPDNLIMEYLHISAPPIIQILFIIAILSAVTSSIDSEAILFSTVFINDIYKKVLFFNSEKVNVHVEGSEVEQYVKEENFALAKSWALVGLIIGFSLTLTPVGLFDFLSIIWVIAISGFGIPVIGMVSKFIRRGISPSYIKFMLWTSIILVLTSSIIAYNRGVKDLTQNSIQTAFGICLLFLFIAIIRSIISIRKK